MRQDDPNSPGNYTYSDAMNDWASQQDSFMRRSRGRIFHRPAALLPNGTVQDHSVQAFNAPPVRNKVGCKIFKQLRVSRMLAAYTKVAGSPNESKAKVVLPDAVDEDSREQFSSAVFHIGNPISERAALQRTARIWCA